MRGTLMAWTAPASWQGRLPVCIIFFAEHGLQASAFELLPGGRRHQSVASQLLLMRGRSNLFRPSPSLNLNAGHCGSAPIRVRVCCWGGFFRQLSQGAKKLWMARARPNVRGGGVSMVCLHHEVRSAHEIRTSAFRLRILCL